MFKFLLIILSTFVYSVGSYSQDTSISKVIRIIDGDTFKLETKEKVRVIGIDTPEKWDLNMVCEKQENLIKGSGEIMIFKKWVNNFQNK